jgi:TonB family protein
VPPSPRNATPVVVPPAPPPVESNPDPPAPKNDAPKKARKDDVPTTTATGKNNNISKTLITRSNPAGKSTSGKTETTAKTVKSGGAANNQRMAAFDKVSSNLKEGLTSGGGLTISDVLGDGVGGGPGAVNYSQAVLGAFDDAWNPPPELKEDRAITVIRVVVHRTGRIVEARITKRSNIHLMDFSVQSALEAVKSLPPFPEGARDLERTFTIEFNLKVKRGSG